MSKDIFVLGILGALLGSLVGCGGGSGGGGNPPPATYTLTVTKSGTGSGTVTDGAGKISCGSSCSATYNNGTSVTLTATPATGSLFTGWSGGCTGTATTCAVTMNQGRSVTAKFDQVVLTVTPATASVTVGGTQQFMPKDQNGNVVDVNWFVNDIQSGNPTVGTIDISGLYTSPNAVPNPPTVTVKACSRDDSTKCGTAAVTVTAPPEKIAFTLAYNGPAGQPEEDDICTIKPDGSGLSQLTRSSRQNWSPDFSPDGKKIVFNSNRDGDTALFVMNTDGGSNQTRINTGFSDPHENSEWPDFSPDGKKVAFIYRIANETGVAVIDLLSGVVTKPVRTVCDNGSCSIVYDHPSWSPDGTQIAFDNSASGNWDIYTMKADGSGITNITNTPINEGHPSWSPDGTQITFDSDATGHWEVYLMDPDGTNVRQLTHTTLGAAGPAWSPDSSTVIFSQRTEVRVPLYTIKADGTEAEKQLPNSPDLCVYPTWARIKQ